MGFTPTTFDPSSISISAESFRPQVSIREGDIEAEAELGFQMSASDAIRMKWAYLLGMLQLGHECGTNHPGFLILDEPRQQETERMSFDALIRAAATSAGTSRQVLFATSERREDLLEGLRGTEANLIRFEGLIIRPLSM